MAVGRRRALAVTEVVAAEMAAGAVMVASVAVAVMMAAEAVMVAVMVAVMAAVGATVEVVLTVAGEQVVVIARISAGCRSRGRGHSMDSD